MKINEELLERVNALCQKRFGSAVLPTLPKDKHDRDKEIFVTISLLADGMHMAPNMEERHPFWVAMMGLLSCLESDAEIIQQFEEVS